MKTTIRTAESMWYKLEGDRIARDIKISDEERLG